MSSYSEIHKEYVIFVGEQISRALQTGGTYTTTKKDLYKVARYLEIPNRSSMSKRQLINAVDRFLLYNLAKN